MSRYYRDDGSWWEIIALFALALVLYFGWQACTAGDRADCENRGGVYLAREAACVQGPPRG